MKGLLVWACSNCRSVMALYRSLAKQLDVPLLVALWETPKGDGLDLRERTGFLKSEFADVQMAVVGEDYLKGLELIDSHSGWHHLFCVYQGAPTFRQLLFEVRRRGLRAGVMCESPCNMSSGLKSVVKRFYLKFILPTKIKPVIRSAEFFVSYSGDASRAARSIGWPRERIIPFGYFPPPIVGSHFVQRRYTKDFTILTTGILSRYRGADVLLRALVLLKAWGLNFKTYVTQTGELLPELQKIAAENKLNVEFTGFLPLGELIQLYQKCSVYVGTGRSEPWGMRLTDALHCGAPLIVSRGMGGVQLVDRYKCGLSFETDDEVDLANKIFELATRTDVYESAAICAVKASQATMPDEQAKELISKIDRVVPGWFK